MAEIDVSAPPGSSRQPATLGRVGRWADMPSSVIRDFTYDAAKRRLDIRFVSGRRYSYHDVPAEVARAMRRASSKGQFFNARIRDRYRFSRDRSRAASSGEVMRRLP
jgi:lysyl-tRNA synthetase class 2